MSVSSSGVYIARPGALNDMRILKAFMAQACWYPFSCCRSLLDPTASEWNQAPGTVGVSPTAKARSLNRWYAQGFSLWALSMGP